MKLVDYDPTFDKDADKKTIVNKNRATRKFILENLTRESIIEIFEDTHYFKDVDKIKKIILNLTDDEVTDLVDHLSECVEGFQIWSKDLADYFDNSEENYYWKEFLFWNLCYEIVSKKLGLKECKKMEDRQWAMENMSRPVIVDMFKDEGYQDIDTIKKVIMNLTDDEICDIVAETFASDLDISQTICKSVIKRKQELRSQK